MKRSLETQIQDFVKSGFKKSKFTSEIYKAMYVHSGCFIAHFNRDEFYKERFATTKALNSTLESIMTIRYKRGMSETKRLVMTIPHLVSEYGRTLKLGLPVFQYIDGALSVQFTPKYRFNEVLNLCNMDACITGNFQPFLFGALACTFKPILTNSDGIACDWIIEHVDKERMIILVHTGHDYKTNGGFIGGSPQRLKKSQEKLKALGYKTKYFSSMNAATKFIETLKVLV